ncbi:P-loop containing nucleoside triphosphate hydrolase protein [Kalaharituber pfeilii]|nr:P-loop containing nucleoside triphosphate hydrolase protein [Kalaharituber pfeilii]
MFSSLRRQVQCGPLCRVVRFSSSSLVQSSSSVVRSTALKHGLTNSALNPSSTTARLFSLYSARNANESFAYKEDAEEAFTTLKKQARSERGQIPELVNFQDLLDHSLIDERVMKAILQDMKFEKMTEVQSKTIKTTLGGNDVLAQAKTGTGKTIAFLLPVLQRILQGPNPIKLKHNFGEPLDIRSIIISPTRELAQQIAKEAAILTKYAPHLQIHTAVGGTGKAAGLRSMHKYGCHLLVATPGRLYDLLTDSSSGVKANKMEILVLDEADNLLDQGFADALTDIIKLMPSTEVRQTLLFSATVPDKVQKMINFALKPKHQILKMVPKNDVPTHTKVEQRLLTVAGFENLLPTLYELMMQEIQIATLEKPFKAIVFFPTAKFAALGAETFGLLRDPETGKNPFHPTRLVEIHSRLTQGQRERAARNFRESQSGILFSSDVTARGMDFPDVTHVFQVGSPMSLEQYIHRIGRTARGLNATGLGYLLLTDIEAPHAMNQLSGTIKLKEYTSHSSVARTDMSKESNLPKSGVEALTRVMEASQNVDLSSKKGAYLANLGYYAYLGKKNQLVASLNRWSTVGWGMQSPPRLSSLLAKRLGLSTTPGIEISSGEVGGRPQGFHTAAHRAGGFAPREGGFRSREGGFQPRGDREGGFQSRGDREGGFQPRGDREGGFQPRGDREGGFQPRGDREGGFQPRGDREGGFQPRGDREGGFQPRGDKEGGFQPRGDKEGGFQPRGDKEGGFQPRGDREGGFQPRGDREGGFKPREGGFASREGGFKPRQEGFQARGDRDGGFRPREDREGGFRPRDRDAGPRAGGFQSRGDREGGFKPRDRGGFNNSASRGPPRQPWQQRGRMNSPGKRFN